MYLHQVIEDTNKTLNLVKKADAIFGNNIERCIKVMKNSICFHLGNMTNLQKIIPLYGKKLFYDNAKYLRMPYNNIWIDWNYSEYNPLIDIPSSHRAKSMKQGIFASRLLRQCNVNNDLIFSAIFNYYDDEKIWSILPYAWIVKIGSFIDAIDIDILNNIFHGLYKDADKLKSFIKDKTNILGMPLASINTFIKMCEYEPNIIENGNIYKTMKKDSLSNIEAFETLLLLLNCKNIVSKNNIPSNKLNTIRTKRGKQQLFSYKTLHVVLPKNKEIIHESKNIGDHNRIHLCRGHFKEYTKDHPLFGKYTGLYWWQPHVRGQNRDGIVMKDYNVKLENNSCNAIQY